MRKRMLFGISILALAAGCAHSVAPPSTLKTPALTAPAALHEIASGTAHNTALPMSLDQAALEAVGQDPEQAAAAIQTLRAAGYAGIDALVMANADVLASRMPAPGISAWSVAARAIPRDRSNATASTLAWERFTAALDAVAMQKDAYASRLFWYTDLEEAKSAAQAQNKPILSLRLLGKLNEELSCANSRFFRTTLYPNAAVSAYLREHFILHWQSVRPVPIVTIDMGDGRSMVRTITGNSIHYVLDSRGRAIDGIPGLYGAKAFLDALQTAYKSAQAAGGLDDSGYRDTVRQFAMQQRRAIENAWAGDLAQVDPDATLSPQQASTLSDAFWTKIAALHADVAALDNTAAVVVRSKIPMEVAMRLTVSKSASESPLVKLLRNLQNSIALDTVKNEYTMHARIDEMIAAGQPLPQLNDRIYAEVFLTPNDDPWLGLAAPDAFAAINNGGIVSMNAASR